MMSNEWDDQGRGAQQDPGPQFDPGQHEQQAPQNQQGQYGQQAPQNQQGQYGQQGPYNQGQYAQQPYPGQQYWSQNPTPYGHAATPAKRSSVLGIVGLVMVVLATGALVAASWSFGTGLGDFFLELAATGVPRDQNELMNDPRTIAYAESVAGVMGAILLSGLVGLTGWIISIVATVTRRGRPSGIAGIVIGLLSLPLAYLAVTWALGPAITQLGG